MNKGARNRYCGEKTSALAILLAFSLFIVACGADPTATMRPPTATVPAPTVAAPTHTTGAAAPTNTAAAAVPPNTIVAAGPTNTTSATATSTSTEVPAKLPPVIIVYGFQGGVISATLKCKWWSEDESKKQGEQYQVERQKYLNDHLEDPNEPYNGLANEIRELGYSVTFGTYLSSPCYTDAAVNNVGDMIKAIDIAKKAPGQQNAKVIIIAHSTGGLVARAYIEDKAQYRGDVAELYTLGAPFNGLVINDVWFAILTASSFFPFKAYLHHHHFQDNFAYFAPSDPHRNYKSASSRNPEVKYHLIGGNLPPGGRGPKGHLANLFGDGSPNDGLVPVSSSLYLEGVQVAKQPAEGHDSGLGQQMYFDKESNVVDHAYRYITESLSLRAEAVVDPEGLPLAAIAARTLSQPAETPNYCRPEGLQTFFELVTEGGADLGVHITDALGQLSVDCRDTVSPTQLASMAAGRGLPVQLVAYDPRDLSVVLSQEPINGDAEHPVNVTGLVDVFRDLPPSIPGIPDEVTGFGVEKLDIPGSYVVTRTLPIYVFAPPDAIPFARLKDETGSDAKLFIFNSTVDPPDRGRVYTLSPELGTHYAVNPQAPIEILFAFDPRDPNDLLSGPTSLATGEGLQFSGPQITPDAEGWPLNPQ